MTLFGGIWDGVQAAVVAAINAVISAFATAIAAVLSVLPNMPDLPALPAPFVTAEGWVAWFFPIGTVVDILSWGALAWLAWQAVQIALRWAKAIS